jgi:hypothetical protein
MSTSTLHFGIFYMLQICDMGPTALLPLRRKACWGFFTLKVWRLRPGLNPWTWVPKVIVLNKRSLFAMVYFLCLFTYRRDVQNLGTRSSLIFCGGSWYLWVLRVEIASWHHSGTQNFEVTYRFLEDSCTSDMHTWICLVERPNDAPNLPEYSAHFLLYVNLQYTMCANFRSVHFAVSFCVTTAAKNATVMGKI